MLPAAQFLQPILAAGQDALLAWLLGCLVMSTVARSDQAAALRGQQTWALSSLILVLILFLLNGSYLMTESGWSDMPAAVWLVLNHSSFGQTVGLALLLAVVWLAAQRLPSLKKRGQDDADLVKGISCLMLCLLAYARAATGHAADQGLLSLAALVHAVHILAAGVWAGSVWVATSWAPGWRRLPSDSATAWAHCLSRTATWAVPILVLTGILDGWRTLGAADHWGGTSYVWILAAKLFLMGCAIGLGLRNRWYWMPRLVQGHDAAISGFGRLLLVEAMVLLGVMWLAGELGQAMLPG